MRRATTSSISFTAVGPPARSGGRSAAVGGPADKPIRKIIPGTTRGRACAEGRIGFSCANGPATFGAKSMARSQNKEKTDHVEFRLRAGSSAS